MRYIRLFFPLLLLLLAAACTQTTEQMPMGQMGMGDMGDMMARHMAPIPAEYADLTNPETADTDSLARGEEIFTASCATCHGDQGGGDGPGAAALDPAPPPLNHTVHMLSDSYLFYRISEGGNFEPFNSAMPAWGDALSETDRWHVINYMRSFEDTTMMGRGMGQRGMGQGGMMGDGPMDHGSMMDNGMMGWGMMAGWVWWLLGCLVLLLLVAVLAAGYFWGKQRATNDKTADS
jgi:mono/diheme cytochrome c family protein